MYTTVNMHMLTFYHYHIIHTHSNYCMVMWSPKGTYFNILKLLNTRRSPKDYCSDRNVPSICKVCKSNENIVAFMVVILAYRTHTMC